MRTLQLFTLAAATLVVSVASAQSARMPTKDRMVSLDARASQDGASAELEMIVLDPSARNVIAKPRLVVGAGKTASVRVSDVAGGQEIQIDVLYTGVQGELKATAEVRRAGQLVRSEKVSVWLSNP